MLGVSQRVCKMVKITFENQSINTMKVTLHLPMTQHITSDVYPEEMKAYIHTKRIFIDTSLINHRAESPDVHQHETDKPFVIKPHNRLQHGKQR